MVCAACQRSNLPGGVRCVYCGERFPDVLDFDLAMSAAPTDSSAPGAAASTGNSAKPPNRSGWMSGLVLLLLKGKSLLTLLKLGPLLMTFGSMAVFVAAEARIYGWQLALGVAIVIFIHEMGHVVMNGRHGIKSSAPMFIPFLGALITVRKFPEEPTAESESAAGGPAFGLAAALVCAAIALATHSQFWNTLAFIGFAINLFNLIPFPPLDGSRIGTVFSPAAWDVVLVSLLLWVLKAPGGLLWLVLLVGFVLRLGRKPSGRHNLAPPAVRFRMVGVYLALCVILSTGANVFGPARRQAHAATTSAASQRGPDAGRQPAASATAAGASAAKRHQPAWMTWALNAGYAVVLSALWFLVGVLLSAASAQRIDKRTAALAGWMALGFLLTRGLGMLSGTTRHWAILYVAYLAALVAALIYAGYHAFHGRKRPARFPHYWLTWHCLAWAAGAALIIGYALDDVWVVAGVALGAAIFFARRPWLLYKNAATVADWTGNMERGLALRKSALLRKPDPLLTATLYQEAAALYMRLGQGEQSLAMLEAAEVGQAADSVSLYYQVFRQTHRAEALLQMDRYDEALRECESMLQAPPGSRSLRLRELLVRCVLAKLAMNREWGDEAEAQAHCILRLAPNGGAGVLADATKFARRTIARAHVLDGRLEGVELACEAALRLGRTPADELQVALIRLQACLKGGNLEGARKEAEYLRRRAAGSLEVRYWTARLELARGAAEARDALRRLAEDFPREHWGRRAQADLAAL